MRRYTWLSVVLTLVLTGCAAYRPASIDPKTGTFGGVSTVPQEDIRVNKPLAGVQDLPFTYVRSFSTTRIIGVENPNEALQKFLEDGLPRIGFPRLVSEEHLTKFVIRKGLSGEIQNLNSILALNRLSNYVGPFLVAEFRIRQTSMAPSYLFETTIIDPVAGEPVFVVSRDAVPWMNFDREILYPMLNAVKQWFDDSKAVPAPLRPKIEMSGEI